MTSRIQKRIRLAAALWALLSGGAMAQDTGFGCRGLLTSDTLPAVEGDAGMFYRIDPELMSLNRVPVEAIGDLARLSRALEAGGTRLIYVPTPTKALAAPQHLPPLAAHLGFDVDLATSVHDEMLGAMRSAGIAVVDARAALRRAGQVAPVFYGPDPRPNLDGQRALAQVVAERIAQTPGFGTLPKTRFVTLEGAEQPLTSVMRFQLQKHCQSDLPPVTAKLSAVSVAPGAAPASGAPQVMVLSSDMTGDPALNFAGQLSAALGLQVQSLHVPQGRAFDAISAYLTSRDFTRARPRYLVWENPVWQNLGSYGDQPMAELLAASGGACEIRLPLSAGVTSTRLVADLGALPVSGRYTLALDTDGISVREARFHFDAGAGLVRTRTIRRAQNAPRSGRFFMPLTALGQIPARLEIELDGAAGPAPSLTACRMEAPA